MRFRDHVEATAFVKALLAAKKSGKRELPGLAKLDSVPQWVKSGGRPAFDGSQVEAVYIAYLDPTAEQVEAARPAKMAGVALQVIVGRLVDVRECSDGTVQVLFTNGLRDEGGDIPWRGPNVDKGILCALSVNEGLNETPEESIARVPEELKLRLKELKARRRKKSRTAKPSTEPTVVTVSAASNVVDDATPNRPQIDVPSVSGAPTKSVKLR